ncbi:hypothetical protein PTTG_01202 [Puccinia triticina 1-1 BBBD Race 1]|uniref:alpha-galactosidase n=2 Tax=Puccinia triticina TaxID=208348 RepID=A0A180GZ32_PUCT1|nr:uncharacterized protein PtA15_10A424 [Puccinia triticina]OAV98085.1 hypothetical protein PTTG_01202 [Puccinia triticina 1-1 BBBD Race 1]WAQ89001.1 hypothetical protein PtA15_10A424 [Puccinia triticina]WAR59058.1 hypothetical protein PtB15_10B400 [Puccinia triticina]
MLTIFQARSLLVLLTVAIHHQAHGSPQASPPGQPLTKADPQTNTLSAATSTYFGWSSWSLQANKGKGYGYDWLNEKNIKAQADVMFKEFSHLGYDRINLDSGWQDDAVDKYGRTVLNHDKFPSGIEHLSSYLAQRKLKLGLFYLPGIDSRAVNDQAVVMNTKYTANQIIQCPDREALGCNRMMPNAFNTGLALNYSHPGAQMYINSVVDGLYSWGVSFVKLAGVVPGSGVDPVEWWKYNTTGDLMAWRKAIDDMYQQKWQKQGREPIWLAVSWKIPTVAGSTMDKYADSFRIEQDIEAYVGTMTTSFYRVIRSVKTSALWSSVDANREWKGIRDLDSILISDMTVAECKTMITIWAMSGSVIYLGDDLTKLPEARKALVKNPEVLKVAIIASTKQARLDGYDPKAYGTRTTTAQPLGQRLNSVDQLGVNEVTEAYQIIASDCDEMALKRQLVVESGLKQKVDNSDNLYQSCMKASANEKSTHLRTRSTTESEGVNPDPWILQTWVLEQGQGDIYVAVVNAGEQIDEDKPAKVQISLSKLKTLQKSPRIKQMTRVRYAVRDLWANKNLSNVAFQGAIDATLETHGPILLKFSPIFPLN